MSKKINVCVCPKLFLGVAIKLNLNLKNKMSTFIFFFGNHMISRIGLVFMEHNILG